MFKFKINTNTWKIEEIPQRRMREIMKEHNDSVQEYGKYFGLTYTDEQTIYIDKDLCNERKRSTLLHELGHCYIGTFITHLDRNYSEEDVADIIANSHDIIKNVVDKYFKLQRRKTNEKKRESNSK